MSQPVSKRVSEPDPAPAAEVGGGDRASLVHAVKTPLAFFVLTVLVVETALGAVAYGATGDTQRIAVYGMLGLILVLIAVVALFAYRKPEALMGAGGVASTPHSAFAERIAGAWWETIASEAGSAISLMEIQPDAATGGVRMKGKGYGADGAWVSAWESMAVCLDPAQQKLHYFWRGWHPARPEAPYEGFGEMSFVDAGRKPERGYGYFSDTDLTRSGSTQRKTIELARCAPADARAMRGSDAAAARAAVLRRLQGG